VSNTMRAFFAAEAAGKPLVADASRTSVGAVGLDRWEAECLI